MNLRNLEEEAMKATLNKYIQKEATGESEPEQEYVLVGHIFRIDKNSTN